MALGIVEPKPLIDNIVWAFDNVDGHVDHREPTDRESTEPRPGRRRPAADQAKNAFTFSAHPFVCGLCFAPPSFVDASNSFSSFF